ncbi:MAG: tetratricopeptide repeat protein [Pseudomonadota bacterium]
MAFNVKKHLMKAQSAAKRGDLELAAKYYREVLELYPANSQAKRGLNGLTTPDRNRAAKAPVSESDVKQLIHWFNEGQLARARGRAETLVRDHPQDPLLRNLLGAIYARLHQSKRALSQFRRATELKPDYEEAFTNLAATYSECGQAREACQAYESALRINPASEATKANLFFERQKISQWEPTWREVSSIRDAGVNGEEVLPFKMLVFHDSPSVHKRRAENSVARLYRRPELAAFSKPASTAERLKIGYFSSDFHDHATMHLMIGMFEKHDRERFEIYTYSFGPPSDGEMRSRLKAVSNFLDVNELTDKEIAQQARADGIHVAVDLKGFTANARTAVFAYRAAPVQISYLGYPGTMGAPYMDYIVADRTVIPEEEQAEYSEAIVYLTHSYQVNDGHRRIADRAPTRQECGLPDGVFVFCCFNNVYKITPAEFDIWARLLNKVPDSVLWLLRSNETAEKNLRAEATKRGVDASRLVFADRTSNAEHLARHIHADLFLDTFTYNAHTTASDALWAGLPVLTCPGRGFPTRVAASLLRAVGLEDTICTSREEYEALALQLATTPTMLRQLKERLAENRLGSPLFDTDATTKHLERAYTDAYQRFASGAAPAPIDLRQ